MEMIGHPLSQLVKLDTRPDNMAIAERLVIADRQVLRFKNLKLQWHRKPVILTAWPQPDKAFTTFKHRPGD